VATERQIEANRLNASRSTGPRTVEGKGRSRLNAWKHGMAADGALVDSDHAEEAAHRRECWGAELRPATDQASFSLDRAVAASLRIELCESTLDGMVVEQMTRARLEWDTDRALDAAALALRLSRSPTFIVRQLESTRHGAELMIEIWNRLGEALEAGGGWDEAQASTALDLLGLAPHLRTGHTPLDPRSGGDAAEHRRALVRREVERLLDRKRVSLDELDTLARHQGQAALLVVLSKPAALVMRYENDAWRRFNRWMNEAIRRPADDHQAATASPNRTRSQSTERTSSPDVPAHDAAKAARDAEARTAHILDLRARVKAMSAQEKTASPAIEGPEPTTLVSDRPEPALMNRRRRRAEKARARRQS
jgi:hypothetical protein